MRFLVSIHDVMPETLSDVERIIAELAKAGWPPATLLVVPGRDWKPETIGWLRRHSERGHPLAGHGWCHSVPRLRSARHWLHSVLISRRAAEHYSLDALGVETLVRRCRGWFDRQRLPVPELYVPPAWAAGPARPREIARAGFRYVETLGGIYDHREGRQISLPVIGYEADTAFRAFCLRRLNAINLRRARGVGAVRLAIHPKDLDLRLADDLRAIIESAPPTAAIEDLQAVMTAA